MPGFERGFHGFHEYHWSERFGKVEDTFPRAERWLRRPREPFFLFLHTYEAHTPYVRTTFCEGLPRGRLPEPHTVPDFPEGTTHLQPLSPEERRYIEAAYDGGVRAATDAAATLLGSLDERGLLGRTVVVILSDHGEEFWDHFPTYARHGHSLYPELLGVPFILRAPGYRGPQAVDAEVSTADLVPTVMDLLGLPCEGPVDGVSLVPLLGGGQVRRLVPILAQAKGGVTGLAAIKVATGPHSYIRMEGPPDRRGREPFLIRDKERGAELYRRDADPRETRSLIGTDAGLAAALAETLAQALARSVEPAPRLIRRGRAGLSPVLAAQLEALGYLAREGGKVKPLQEPQDPSATGGSGAASP